MGDRTAGSASPGTYGRRDRQSPENEALLRQLVADAARTVLEEKARGVPEPIAYLRSAAAEITQLVALLAPAGSGAEAGMRALIAEELEAAAEALIRRLQN